MLKPLMIVAALLISTMTSISAVAQPLLSTGDIIVSGIPHGAIPEDAAVLPFRILDASLNVKLSMKADSEIRMVIDASHNVTSLYGVRYNAAFQPIGYLHLYDIEPISITVANDGRAFILGGSRWLSMFAEDGTRTMIPPWDFGSVGPNIDLAPDQCTLVFTGAQKRVRRYDVCQSAFQPDFARDIPGGYVRALSDGGVAVLHDKDISFYDANGRLTYSLAGIFTGKWFTFDSAPGVMWVSNTRIRLSDGALLGYVDAPEMPQSIAVVDAHIPSSTSMIPRRRGVSR